MYSALVQLLSTLIVDEDVPLVLHYKLSLILPDKCGHLLAMRNRASNKTTHYL